MNTTSTRRSFLKAAAFLPFVAAGASAPAPAAESALKLDDRLRVMQVLDGSGAMRASIN
jgi:hypothetical protein